MGGNFSTSLLEERKKVFHGAHARSGKGFEMQEIKAARVAWEGVIEEADYAPLVQYLRTLAPPPAS